MSDQKLIKPRLNSYVWVKEDGDYYHTGFFKVKAVALGKEFFVHEGVFDLCIRDEFRVPLYYKDKDCTWFKSLKDIRAKYNIVKIDEYYYEKISGGSNREQEL